MAERTKNRASHQSLDSTMEFEDHELQATMQEFLEEEKKANTNIWNFATIAGIAMFFVGIVYLIQSIGIGLGPDMSDLIEIMPLIGGILVTLVGFGFLVGDRKKEKKDRKRKSRNRNRQSFDFEEDAGDFGLGNDLDDRTGRRGKTKTGSYSFDTYAFRQSKKLYKSRSDRKWAGVCGGLAKYFGISSTVVRLLFVITFFASSGASLLAYIALAIALDKEPPEMMDDFRF
jgi:phage shock protein C